MGTFISPEVGDFLVINGIKYGASYGQIIKVTDHTVYFIRHGCTGELVMSKGNMIFAGAEETAANLVEQLQSSRTQQKEDNRCASARRIRRDQKFIDKARGVYTHDTGRS